MDIFIEEIVEKKRNFKQFAASFGIVLLGVLVAFIISAVLPAVLPVMTSLVPLLVIGVFYLAYRLVVSQNVEFEYSMVNTEIDVDKIINRRNRKRLTNVRVTGLEAHGFCGSEKNEFNRYISDVAVKKIYAATEKNSESNYFVVYMADGVKTILIFSPSEKIINNIEKFRPKR